MTHSRQDVSLLKKDYEAVLEIITRLMSHKTARSLTHLFESHLLPLLEASSCFYAWADLDNFRLRIVDAVGIPKSDFNTIQAYFQCCPLARHMTVQNSLVETYDLDLPRPELQGSVAGFFEAHPASQLRGSSYLDELSTILLTLDRSEPAIVVEFHRLDASGKSFTRREKRILEFLLPHLCQAIRTVVVNEGLDGEGSTTDKDPLGSRNPTAQVSGDSRIVDQNRGFGLLFHSLPGDTLCPSLTRILESGIRDCQKSSCGPIPETRTSWYCSCPSVYQVDVTRRKDDLWIVELHPLSDVCPGFNPVLRQYGLTAKEKEVCCKVRQGCDNREIASQLCVSFHTAKTHLKNIYRKLEIPNRPRLVSFLNKQ